MSRLGPIVTLTAGAVLAVGLGVASITATPAADTTVATADETATEAPEETPENTETENPETAAAAPSASPTETPTFEETTPPAPKKGDYAGRVRDNGGLIAISVRNGKAVGYFCDGKTEAWFKGDAGSRRTGAQKASAAPRSRPSSVAARPPARSRSAARSGASPRPSR